MYKLAGAAGYTPDEVRAMSFYDYGCVVGGFSEFHSTGEDEGKIDTAEAERLKEAIRNPPPWIN